MKILTPTYTRVLLVFLLAATAAHAQQAQTKAPDKPAAASSAKATASPAPVITAESTPLELARAAFQAQGGEKFRQLKNMVLIGAVDMYSPGSTQSLTGKFGLIFAGERMRMNIQTPLFQLEGIFDGERSYVSMPRVTLPPMNKYGLPTLAKFDQTGYTVTALPDKKKQRAFRITDIDGHATDFYIDATTARLVRFEVTFNDLLFSVENTKVQEFEGVLVPVNSTWRIDLPTGPAYAEFHAKEIKVNQTLPADAFAIPGQ
ncbi:MAG: hypothetical protein DMF64_03760 [Acidobacteria bacterium]|nr:MAG: hypothetical protein DMF64_03760 [Acidobacteriota bacterium]